MKTTDYEQQALDFLSRVGAKMTITKIGRDINKMWNENVYRPKYKVMINRKVREYRWTFTFWGNPVNDEVTAYDVLSCIEKYEPATDVEDFAREYGYDYEPWEDPKEARRIERIHTAVIQEYKNCYRMFGDVMEQLREI